MRRKRLMPSSTSQDVRAGPPRFQGLVKGGVVPDANERLAKIAALQHGPEGLRRLPKPRPQVLFILDFAFPDPAGHLCKKIGLMLFDEVPYMEMVHLDVLALEGEFALCHPG